MTLALRLAAWLALGGEASEAHRKFRAAPGGPPTEPGGDTMTRTRTLTALLTAALLIGPTMTTTAQAKWNWQGPCDGWRYGETVTHETPLSVIQTRMERLITCVFNRFAPGNVRTALYVADRESNLWPWAWNRSSDCRGLFQHKGPYWAGRVKKYLWRGWYPAADWPNVTALNPHANAIAAAKMVKRYGWAPWSTA